MSARREAERQLLLEEDTEEDTEGEEGEREGGGASPWLTGIAVCPYGSRDIFAGQYRVRGVQQFDRGSLAYKRRFKAHVSSLAAPEGLAFTHHSLYVASCDNYSIVRLSYPDARILQVMHLATPAPAAPWQDSCEWAPWGLTVGPAPVPASGAQPGRKRRCRSCSEPHASEQQALALYVAVDAPEDRDNYAEMPSRMRQGQVLMLPLDARGRMLPPQLFCEPGFLTRPSGLCFNADNDLFVTSLEGHVAHFSGPASVSPGKHLGVAVSQDMLLAKGKPWDVRWFGLPGLQTLLVSVHHAEQGCPDCALLLFRCQAAHRRGPVQCVLDRVLLPDGWSEPNMLAVLE